MGEASDSAGPRGGRDAAPLEGLPDSAQRVYRALAVEGPLTHKELVAVTGMPARTVRFAVARLREEGLVGQRSNLMDGRQRFFFVTSA